MQNLWYVALSIFFFLYACHEPHWSARKQRLHLQSAAGISRQCADARQKKRTKNPCLFFISNQKYGTYISTIKI